MATRVIRGDVRDVLPTLAAESVQCVITSPPYFGLRDYGTAQWEGGDAACSHAAPDDAGRTRNHSNSKTHPGRWAGDCYRCGATRIDRQIGLEATAEEHIAVLVDVFREVKRILRHDGVLWLNYGDTYASTANGRSAADTKAAGNDDRTFRDKPFSTAGAFGAKPKDLLMMPARVAMALQADGWYLRAMLPWVKRSAMPESAKDRPTSAVEHVFLLTKSARYFYDHVAVRSPLATASVARISQASFDTQTGGPKDPHSGNRSARNALENLARRKPAGWDTAPGAHDTVRHNRPDKQRGHASPHAGFNDRWDRMGRKEQQADGRNFRNSDLFYQSLEAPFGLISDADGEPLALDVPPQPFPGAHFATFPERLVEPLILAGTSAKGACAKCGAPWRRETRTTRTRDGEPLQGSWHGSSTDGTPQRIGATGVGHWRDISETITLGWRPSCECGAGVRPCVCLDPFGGSGTVGLVADRLGRDAILVELSDDYANMAESRITADAPLLA